MGEGQPVPASVRARPHRLRIACVVLALVVVVMFAAAAVLLRRAGQGEVVGLGDELAMVGLGVLVAGGVLWLGRPTLEADDRGLRVVNVFGRYDLPWTVVRAVTFRNGSPWASVDLADDETVALMAVQAIDGERAVAAVRGLREMHARYGGG